jgi:tetratricopeptide (TPR) repeat protein
MDEREQSLRTMTAEFPESPLPWFSLGKYLEGARRFAEAAEAFERCVGFDPDYAAALMSLGDARAALGEDDAARVAWERCEKAALAQGHPTLAGEARERIAELSL